MNKKSLILCTSVAGLVSSHQAFGQDGSSALAIRPSTFSAENSTVGVNIATGSVDLIDENVFSFGAFADFATSPSFSVGFSLDYWNDDFNSSAQRRVEMGDIIIGANTKFHFTDVTRSVRPYVLAGLAGHILQVSSTDRNPSNEPNEVLSSRDRHLEDAEFEMGVDFGAGLTYRIQPAMDVIGEVRYRRLFEQTLDLDQLNLSVALAYSM